jgi:hypothetical protein
MLRTLSYLNLIAAVCYFLVYLQNGSRLIIAGLLCAVVYQWLVLRSEELGQGGGNPVMQRIFAALSLLFALYLGYSAALLLLSAVEYQYYPENMLLLTGSGLLLMLGLLFHLFLSWRANSVKKDE